MSFKLQGYHHLNLRLSPIIFILTFIPSLLEIERKIVHPKWARPSIYLFIVFNLGQVYVLIIDHTRLPSFSIKTLSRRKWDNTWKDNLLKKILWKHIFSPNINCPNPTKSKSQDVPLPAPLVKTPGKKMQWDRIFFTGYVT